MSTLFLPSVTLNVGSALRIIDDMCLLIRQRVNCMWFNKYMVIYVTSIDINIIRHSRSYYRTSTCKMSLSPGIVNPITFTIVVSNHVTCACVSVGK